MLEFPLFEYVQRIARLVSAMEERDLDAILLTTRENTRYFTGFRSIVWDSKISKPGAVIITRDGEPVLVCIESGLETASVTSCVETFVKWNRLSGQSYAEAVFAALQERGVERGRIGMELGIGFRLHLTHDDYVGLMGLLSEAEVVDAGPAIWQLRMRKSKAEIDCVRRVCDINCRAFGDALSGVYEGMTEMELFQSITRSMLEHGAEEVFPLGIRAGADRYSQGNCPPGNRPIGLGEIILIDGGPAYRGYWSDIIREGVIGEPSPRQRELHKAAVEACMVGVDMVRPGVTPAEICAAIDKFIDDAGYGELYDSRGSAGHGLGLDVHEPPLIDKNNHQPLVAGMYLAIEPSLYEPGCGKFNIEENILVTDSGYELLTPLCHDLWVR